MTNYIERIIIGVYNIKQKIQPQNFSQWKGSVASTCAAVRSTSPLGISPFGSSLSEHSDKPPACSGCGHDWLSGAPAAGWPRRNSLSGAAVRGLSGVGGGYPSKTLERQRNWTRTCRRSLGVSPPKYKVHGATSSWNEALTQRPCRAGSRTSTYHLFRPH